MFDISAVGASAIIKFKNGSNIVIDQFSDEGTPFEAPDVDVSTNAKNLNGQMISSRTPSIYAVALTVIPGSDADIELTKRLRDAAIQPNNVVPIDDLIVESLSINVPKINASAESFGGTSGNVISYKWTNGRMKSGPTGPSTSAEGRMSARTFNFEFEKFDAPNGSGSTIGVNGVS